MSTSAIAIAVQTYSGRAISDDPAAFFRRYGYERCRGRREVRGPDPPAPPRAAHLLSPDARVVRRGRGPRAGGVPAGVAVRGRVRGAFRRPGAAPGHEPPRSVADAADRREPPASRRRLRPQRRRHRVPPLRADRAAPAGGPPRRNRLLRNTRPVRRVRPPREP